MNRVAHFEIGSKDPQKAAEFYKKALGWKIDKWEGPEDYWLITTGEGEPGINGALFQRPKGFPEVTNTVEVESVDAVVTAVEAAGGTVVKPKHPVPGIGWQAYCRDPDGILFGLHQPDASAA